MKGLVLIQEVRTAQILHTSFMVLKKVVFSPIVVHANCSLAMLFNSPTVCFSLLILIIFHKMPRGPHYMYFPESTPGLTQLAEILMSAL